MLGGGGVATAASSLRHLPIRKIELVQFFVHGGRRFGKVRLLLEHGSAFKSMARLGAACFGPKCATCGKPQTQFMAPRHRAALKALNDGRSPESLDFACRCV